MVARLALVGILLALGACASKGPVRLSDAELDHIRAGTLGPEACAVLGPAASACLGSYFDVTDWSVPFSSTCNSSSCFTALPVTSDGPTSLTQSYRSPTTYVEQRQMVAPLPVDPRVLEAQQIWLRHQDWLLTRPQP